MPEQPELHTAHRRGLGTLARAVFDPRHYIATYNMFRLIQNPVWFLYRYVSGKGQYPAMVKVRTPTGPIALTTYSPHDLWTINEIFCRNDYKFEHPPRVVVDFGSNIGISAAYFLSRSPDCQIHLYEPLPRNVERLKGNLQQFDGRYTLSQAAVGSQTGTVSFGVEDTGKYGGIGRQTGKTIQVDCVDSNGEIERLIAKYGIIDMLKIDIETMEEEVTKRITPSAAEHISDIVVEFPFKENPLSSTHTMQMDVFVTRFSPKSPTALH